MTLTIHGTGGSADANWAHHVERFASDRTFVRPDYAGSGDTRDDGDRLELDEFAAQVAAATEDAGAVPFDLVQFSLWRRLFDTDRDALARLTRDHIVPVERSRALHAAIPGSGYAELDTGHLGLLEQPDLVAATIRTFLERSQIARTGAACRSAPTGELRRNRDRIARPRPRAGARRFRRR